MTRISAYLQGTDEKSRLAQQADASNQRESWLRQMELAQLAGMNQSGTSHGTGTEQHQAFKPKLQIMPQAQPSADRPAPSTQASGHAGSAADNREHGRANPDAAGNHTAQEDAHSATAEHAQPTASGSTQDNNASGNSVSEGTPRQDRGPGQATDIRTAAYQASLPVSAETANQAVSAAAMAGMSAAQAGATHALPGVQNVEASVIQAIQARPISLPDLSASMADGNEQDAASDLEEAGQEPAVADSQLEERPTWQKRMMHLTGEGQDVDVWIRDSELGASQSQNLISRLAGDIASMGMRLKGATINGKLAFRSSAATQGRARLTSADENSTDSKNHSIVTTTEEDHGTQ